MFWMNKTAANIYNYSPYFVKCLIAGSRGYLLNRWRYGADTERLVREAEKREFCAGSVAKVFEELGGKVEYFGKPYPKVYNQAAKIKNKKVFCIGDNLNTDIKGANNQNFASLLITNGIHKQEIKNESFEKIIKKYNTRVDYTQSKLKW